MQAGRLRKRGDQCGGRVWWTASPANQTISFKDSDKALRASCAPDGAEENAPSVQGSLFQDVACTRKTAFFAPEPKTSEIQSIAKLVIAFSPLSAISAPLRPAKMRRDRRHARRREALLFWWCNPFRRARPTKIRTIETSYLILSPTYHRAPGTLESERL